MRLLVLWLAIVVPSPQAPIWEQKFPGNVVDVSAPAAAPCIAVLTTGNVAVVRHDGTPIWRRSFQQFSKVFQARTVAVAPSCDWVVVTGDPSYRYAWVLRRDGRDEHVGFGKVTPLSAAVHPDGHQVAIATGGRSIHIADADPFVVRKTIPYRGIPDLQYASADALLLSRYGAGVIDSTESVKWTEWSGVCDISVPDDLAWSVTACSPPHFSSIGSVTVRARDGTQRWSSVLDYPHAAAAPDGAFVAVLGADVTVQGVREIVGEQRLRFVRPDGTLMADAPFPEGDIVGVTGAGLAIVRQYRPTVFTAFSKDGAPRATIELIDWAAGARLIGGDRSKLLVWNPNLVQVFATPK